MLTRDMPFSQFKHVEGYPGVYHEENRFIKAKGDERNLFRFERYVGKRKEERKRNAVAHAEAHVALFEKLARAEIIHPQTLFAVVGKGHSVRISLSQPEMIVPKYGMKFESIVENAEDAQRLRAVKEEKIARMRELLERHGVKPHNDWQHEFNWGLDEKKSLYFIDSDFLLEQLPSKKMKKPLIEKLNDLLKRA